MYALCSNSKGLSKSVLAIGSSSHRSSVILERKNSGSDPGNFITLVYFIEIGENSVLYLKCNVYFIEKKKENGYNLKIGH
jgi:hypothetical protein